MTLAAEVYSQAFNDGLAPDPDLTLDEWSNSYRVLSQKSSAEPGPYRIERTPFLREIARELSPSSPTQRIVFMKSAQVGASELGFNWLGYIMHSVPGPTMMVQPTIELAEKVSKQRISSMIEETPALRGIVAPEKSRDSSSTILLKNFRGGVLSMTGANSAVGLRSMPVRYLFCDEVDGYPPDVGGEGDAVSLAEKRTTTFSRRKIFLVSTPLVKDASRIEAEYLASDQRRYFVPCPHCGALQWLQWKQVRWAKSEDGSPIYQTASYECEHCNEWIPEHHKTDMLARGEWLATAPGDGKTVGFHISALYSPVGWKSWASIVEEFHKAKGDAPLLKSWVNTVLGETWEEEYSAKLGADSLMERAEPYSSQAPAGVLVVVGGVDIQDNRAAISRYGYGRDEESWLIDHAEIFGDPARPEFWKQIDDRLQMPIEHELGGILKPRYSAIDSGGHFTHEVYQFTRANRAKGYLAVKGASQKGKPAISKPSKVDVNFRGQVLKSGAEVYLVGTDTVKGVLYGRLKHNEPGPAYIHFPLDLGPDFYEQLTAEKQIVKYVKGFPVKEWTKKSGARNEALDCAVYAYAILQFLLNHFNRKTVWDQLEKSLPKKAEISPDSDVTRQNKPLQNRITPGKKNFVNGW